METLIQLVQKHPALYNSKIPYYRDQITRQKAWEEIGKELNLEPDTAKKHWDRIRRSYLNAMMRRRHRDAKSADPIHPWKYESEMSFLLPFIESKKQKVPKEEEIFLNEIKIDRNDDLTNDKDFDTSFYNNHHNDNSSRNSSDNISIPSVKRSKPDTFQDSQRLFEKDELKSYPPMDANDMFFMSMSAITKTLPVAEQAKIKLQLSTSVFEAQLRLSEKSQNRTVDTIYFEPSNSDLHTEEDLD